MVTMVDQVSQVLGGWSPESGLDVFFFFSTSGGAGAMRILKLWFGAGGCTGRAPALSPCQWGAWRKGTE